MDLAGEFMHSREFQDFVDACDRVYNHVAFTSKPLSDWSSAYTLFRKHCAEYEKRVRTQAQARSEPVVKALNVKTKMHTPCPQRSPSSDDNDGSKKSEGGGKGGGGGGGGESDSRTDKLFRTSKPYTHACRRCEKKIVALERKIEEVSEELGVRTQAENNAHREQMQARVSVTMAQAINNIVEKGANSLNSVYDKYPGQVAKLASDWTMVLKELQKGRRACETHHRRLHDDLNVLEQEAGFLMHATPDMFLEYLRDRGGDDDDDDEDENRDYTHESVAFTISDEAKTSVLEAAAAVDREHRRNAQPRSSRSRSRLHRSRSRSSSNSSGQRTREKPGLRPDSSSPSSPSSSSDDETPRSNLRSRSSSTS